MRILERRHHQVRSFCASGPGRQLHGERAVGRCGRAGAPAGQVDEASRAGPFQGPDQLSSLQVGELSQSRPDGGEIRPRQSGEMGQG